MIDSSTSLYGVFGNPVAHSLSPVMHNCAFAATGFNGVYLAFKVMDIAAAVAAIKAVAIKGVSVTIPHKIAVMDHLDEVDAQAARIGAVNTILNQDGRLIGYNSDCLGALTALSQKTVVKDADVIILGAGGAARAIGFGIIAAGGRVTIVNRGVEKGERLARDLGAPFQPLSELKRINGRILINTTPVGMTPQIDVMPIDKSMIEKDMLVMDIVYNPVKTFLLKAAEERGCQTLDGVAMFVHQGAFQFKLWTGVSAPVEVMRAAVVEALTPVESILGKDK